jgi:ABC-2 type transport system ATP-binding protein
MDSAIVFQDIHKSFTSHFWQSPKNVLRGIDLTVFKGEIFGFLGPNGAGKTTTIKIATNLLVPDKGAVTIFGSTPDTMAARERTGFLPEAPHFYDHLTGHEFLRIHGILSNQDASMTRVRDLMETVGLKNAGDIALRKYSRGMLQRIGLAQALIGNPDLLILDEPLSGLDPIGRKEIKDLILEQKNQGKTVFFSSHILPDAQALCDRIAIITEGTIRTVDTLDAVMKQYASADTTLEQWFVDQVKKDRS